MIIKTHKKYQNGIIKAEFEGQNLKVMHIENLTPIMAAAYEARQDSIGESRKIIGDSIEHIAYLPPSVMVENPEFWKDMKALRKWLRGPGAKFRTSTRQI